MNIGILGAGQLSRMLAIAGIPMGFNFIFYSPSDENCVKNLGKVINKPYDDKEAVIKFVSLCDVITYENENIPYETAVLIESLKPLYPNANTLLNTQDRLLEKQLFQLLKIPTVHFKSIDSYQDLFNFIQEYDFPVIIKKRTQGYDGKGQIKIYTNKDLVKLEGEILSNLIVEKMINFEREVSIIGTKSRNGEVVYYDICENNHINGILERTRNIIKDPIFENAKIYLNKVIEHFNYVGCLAFEFFQYKGILYANELAPRVHNTGHWTIEGTLCNQFENHIRAIAGLPLGNTDSIAHFEMRNIIGELPSLNEILNLKDTYFHDYQKEPKSGRKLGHISRKL